MDLSPCCPSLPAAKSSQDGTPRLHRAAKGAACSLRLAALPGHRNDSWWNREKKTQKSPLPHTLMDPTALHRRRENLHGATQMTKSIHQAGHARSYSLFSGKQPSTWQTLVTAPSSGLPESHGAWGRELREHREHRDTGPPVRVWCWPFVPQSQQPMLALLARICKTIPHNNPSNLFETPQVLQDWQNRARKHSLLSHPPHTPLSIACLPFLCSARFISARLQEPGREGNMSALTETSSSVGRSLPRDSGWKKVVYMLYWYHL